jgi:two-component system, NarL family, sensor kinase
VERPPASPFNDQLSLKRLVARYVVTGLVTLIVVAVATSLISRRLGTLEAINDADRVSSIAASSLAPVVTDALLTGDKAAIQQVDWAVRNQVLKGSLVRVKIWASDGTILYSDEARLIGQKFDFEEDK